MARAEAPRPHFFKIILSHAQEHKLEIPMKFMSKYGKDLPSVVYLNVRGGAKWRVKLSKCNGRACFNEGWEEFVRFYSIVLGHFLLFGYEGNSRFRVVIFDMSGSEIDYPSQTSNIGFEEVKEDIMVHDVMGQVDTRSDDVQAVSVEILSEPPPIVQAKGDKEMSTPRAQKHWHMYDILEQGGAYRCTRRRKAVVERSWLVVLALESLALESSPRKDADEPPLSRTEAKEELLNLQPAKKKRRRSEKMEMEKPSLDGLTNGWRAAQFKQNWLSVGGPLARSYVAAVDAASRHVSKYPSFMVVMTQAYLSKFSVNLPIPFVRKYIKGSTREIHIQVYNRSWPVNMCIYEDYGTKLSRGWRAFREENHLQVGDVCVFELIKRCVVTLNTIIYRCRSA